MKALTFASVFAVSMAGAACSQQAQAPDATEPSETANESPEAEGSQFNLRYPTGNTQPAGNSASSGQFNLRGPGSAQQGPGGLRLPDGSMRDDALTQMPEVQQPGVPAGDKVVPGEAGNDPAANPDDIIRLDE